tara:strand:+ start:1252 stop:1803 length:552 start_codon:yes stop_codon:yes gene_type:complete
MYDQAVLFDDPDDNDPPPGSTLVEISEGDRRKYYLFERLLWMVGTFAEGENNCKTKGRLWQSTIDMWDETSEFAAPTIGWYKGHHKEWNKWCLEHKGVPLVFSTGSGANEGGLYVANAPEQVRTFRKVFLDSYANGVSESLNLRQSVLEGRSELDAEHGTRLTASDGGLLNDPDSDLDHQLEG